LLYFFFNKFKLSKEVPEMAHFYPTYRNIAEKKGYKWKTTYEKPYNCINQGYKFMEIFMEETFAIKFAFKFNQATARILQKGLQMQQYRIIKMK
jgi:hypothetical protein